MPSSSPHVIIYSTHTCNYCKLEKAWLDEQGIAFTSYFVDEDLEKAREMIELSNQKGTPVTRIVYDDGEESIIVGFDQEMLEMALNLKEN